MPAKFVYLFQFCEIKIFPQVQVDLFVQGGVDPDGIIAGFYFIDMCPVQELTLWEPRKGDARMVKGQDFLRIESPLAIEEVTVNDAQHDMNDPRTGSARQEHD